MSQLAERFPYLKPFDAQIDARYPAYLKRRAGIIAIERQEKLVDPLIQWTDMGFSSDLPPMIYEVWPCENAGWTWMAENILPEMQKKGYNTLSLMARPAQDKIPYMMPTTDFGSRSDLCGLINAAHHAGIRVLFDVVGPFIHNPETDEMLQQLIEFLRMCLHYYHADGFRFACASYPIYKDHGEHFRFENLDQYFSDNVVPEGITLLQVANNFVHEYKPDAITIAEEVTGMPGVAEPIEDGGLGFDFRMAMGVPAMWQQMANMRDENWQMDHIWQELGRRNGPSIATVEDHVQVFNGCQTLMTKLSGDLIRSNSRFGIRKLGVDRGIALHKMIRLATYAAAGEGVLNTVGTEGGCPDWPDASKVLPLLEDKNEVYHCLAGFDRDLIALLKKEQVLGNENMELRRVHNNDHILAFRRAELLFVFNFDPTCSYEGYGIPVKVDGNFELLLSTDDTVYAGFNRVAHMSYPVVNHEVKLYLPARCALVLKHL